MDLKQCDEKGIGSSEMKQVHVMGADPCLDIAAEDVLTLIKNIKTEEELAKLFALADNKAWWVEDDVYDYEEGTTEYLKACEIRDTWFSISDELREKIFSILREEKISIPEKGQITVLRPFMERNGFYYGTATSWMIIARRALATRSFPIPKVLTQMNSTNQKSHLSPFHG